MKRNNENTDSGLSPKDEKRWEIIFNNEARKMIPKLKNDERNFYKIYCKYGPQ